MRLWQIAGVDQVLGGGAQAAHAAPLELKGFNLAYSINISRLLRFEDVSRTVYSRAATCERAERKF